MSPEGRILEALAHAAPAGVSSFQLTQATRLSATRLYPALKRLECSGRIVSEWEKPEPAFEPRRRLYWIGGGGR